MKPFEQITLVLNPADANGKPGVQTADYSGTMVFIKSATAGFSMRFDAGDVFDAIEGIKLSEPSGFNKLTFYNYNSFPITINFYVGQIGVDYVGPNVTIPAPTQLLGNFGIAGAGDIVKVFGQKVNTIARLINCYGTNYLAGDILQPPDGNGTPAQILVTKVSQKTFTDPGGAISMARLISPGNYSVLPATPSTVIGGTGNGAKFALTFVALTGAVLGVSGAWLTITNAGALTIPAGGGNNARKSITFKVKSNSAGGLLIQDANGCTLRDLAAGEEESFETSGALQIIADSGNTCTFTSSELYYL